MQGRTIVSTGAKKRDGASCMLSLSIPAPREPSVSRVAMGEEPSSPRIASERDLTRALDVLREFGMVGVGLDGQVVSIRRHAASALQNPSGKSTDLMTSGLYVENISLQALEYMLDTKYWDRHEPGREERARMRFREERVEFTTDSSKALNNLFCAQETRHLGQDAAKLICPKGHKEATLMVFASPPASMKFRRRADGSEVVEGSFNLSTLNQVLHAPRTRPPLFCLSILT